MFDLAFEAIQILTNIFSVLFNSNRLQHGTTW